MNTETLTEFVALCQHVVDTYMAAHFPRNPPKSISAEVGKRYARIVIQSGSGLDRSVFGFVDMTNGDLLKAASWKGPAKGVRGNVLRAELGCVDSYGIR